MQFSYVICQICSDNNLKFPPMGGLGASDGGAIAPASPPMAPPLACYQVEYIPDEHFLEQKNE